MTDLSVIIPARNEEFLAHTIDEVLLKSEGDTEVIAILDGYWPEPGIKDNERVTLIHHVQPIGQRAAVNEGARISTAKYIMKLDAHCALDDGFDVKLMADCEHDWTVIPRMYNLHVFDWVCSGCGKRAYQASGLECCGEIKKEIIWKEKRNPTSDFMRFDRDMKFQYWREYKKRPEAKGDICDLMSAIGACFFMERSRFWEIGGLDEKHGFWGQFGTEIACKSWLSGGRHVVNKKTWFAHMFRTGGALGFPYRLPGRSVLNARKYSNSLWKGNKWDKATRTLDWLVDKFAPVPDWESRTKGLVYYTDNRLEERIAQLVRKYILSATNGHALVSVTQYPIVFGDNIHMPLERSVLSMFKQILKGLESLNTTFAFMVEHDVLYHPSHFDFEPPRDDVYYYNKNVWKVDARSGQALFYDGMKQTSGLVANRKLLIDHYSRKVELVERDGFTRRLGFEPGKKPFDTHKYDYFESKHPNVDIGNHGTNLTRSRFKLSEYRCRNRIKDSWILADEVPFWGVTKGRMDEFIRDTYERNI